MREFSARVRFYLDHRWAPNRFSAHLDGELAGRQRGRMNRHLAECAECRGAFGGLSAVVDALRQLPSAQPARTPAQLAAAVRIELGDPPNSGR
jgi:anti-sigma factor RsiW